MPLIKLDAIDSTNSYLRALIGKQNIEDFTIVSAKHQTNGRGQMGALWSSEADKNLMFSVFVDVSKIELVYPFYLSIVTSLAIRKSLHQLSIPRLKIKWPNDILSQNKKICGILIENVIKEGIVNASIIGIGLNVNQVNFKYLPNASSLKSITGSVFNLEEVLHTIVTNLKFYFLLLEKGNLKALKDEYESHLFRKNKPSTFKDAKGNLFSGFITSILDTGDLQITLEDDIIKSFTLKDVTLLY